MKKIITLLLFFIGGSLLLLLTTFAGCRKTDATFFFKDMSVTILQDATTTPERFLAEGDTGRFQGLSFVLSFHYNILAHRESWAGNSLYAFQPGNSHFENIDKIKTVRLITIFPYRQFQTGTDITELLEDSLRLISNLNQDFTGSVGAPEIHVRFKLKSPPDSISSQKFVLELLSENNTILRDTTVLFYIQP